MSKNKNTILIFGIIGILIAGFGFSNSAEAANSSIYVSPASQNKEVGDIFNISVKVNPGGEKVCVVEGKLLLDKLDVQDIKVPTDEGVFSQTSPSFSNGFYFLLGVEGCTTQDKTLFTARVKAKSAGSAEVSFQNVDIIGEGVSISSDFSSGIYTLTFPSLPPSTEIISCNCDVWGAWQDGECGDGDCTDSQRLQTRQRTCTPSDCDIETQIQCVNDTYCNTLLAEGKEKVPAEGLLAAIGAIPLNLKILLGIAVVVIIGLIILWFSHKKKRKMQ